MAPHLNFLFEAFHLCSQRLYFLEIYKRPRCFNRWDDDLILLVKTL